MGIDRERFMHVCMLYIRARVHACFYTYVYDMATCTPYIYVQYAIHTNLYVCTCIYIYIYVSCIVHDQFIILLNPEGSVGNGNKIW